MRPLFLFFIAYALPAVAIGQSSPQDQALLAKTRALYDAPFNRDLISFDCAVTFDWNQHFVDLLGTTPPAAKPVIERLQLIPHRVFVDRTGAVVSAIPKAPDLTGIAHAQDLEQGLQTMVAGGLNAWLPSATNVLLPVGPTKYSWEKIDTGYKLTLNGAGVAAQLLLQDDLRLSSGVTELPQPMRFVTDYKPGSQGLLLASIKTGDTTDVAGTKQAKFEYIYQAVEGFQLPHAVTVTPASPEVWRYTIDDCKVMRGIRIELNHSPQ